MRGTRVLTPERPVPIDAITAGDEVFSFAHATGKIVTRRVQRVRRSVGLSLMELRTEDVHIAGVTPDHPFRHADEPTFTPVAELAVGDRLLAWFLERPEERAITELTMLPVDRPTAVFNLTLEGGEQCYFVEGLLVGG